MAARNDGAGAAGPVVLRGAGRAGRAPLCTGAAHGRPNASPDALLQLRVSPRAELLAEGDDAARLRVVVAER